MEYRRCSMGLWDTSVPGISFNEKGVSNFAEQLLNLMKRYPRGDQGRQDWDIIIKQIKEKGRENKYDCIVGLSGGTDSCYLLYLCKEWGLRPLAVTVDNGFTTKIALQNILKITEKLCIDLETVVVDYDDVKSALKAYMKASLPWVDSPSDHAIKSSLFLAAKQHRIKYVLNGHDFRTEGKQPFLWTASDYKQLKFLANRFSNSKLRKFPALSPIYLIYLSKILGIRRENPFYYIDYDKTLARGFLEKEFLWEYYGEHHHENSFTKFIISYWLYEKFHIDKRIITYSGQVIAGLKSRDEALKIISQKPWSEDTIQRDLDYIIKKLSITQNEFEQWMKADNKSILDYPSYYRIIFRHKTASKWVIKNLMNYEPLFLDQVPDISKNSNHR